VVRRCPTGLPAALLSNHVFSEGCLSNRQKFELNKPRARTPLEILVYAKRGLRCFLRIGKGKIPETELLKIATFV
jgi:hypothetical protein